MTAISKKSIIDDATILLTKFSKTDETKLDEDYLSYKTDQIRADLIIAKYAQTNEIDPSWTQDMGLISFTKTNITDNQNISVCDCPVSKAEIPQIISLSSGNGSFDLGIYSLMSSCGKKTYFPYELSKWAYLPPNHTRNLFSYYSRINTTIYVNKYIDQLRGIFILHNPEDAYIKTTAPVTSGSLVNGTVYLVKYGQVVYNGTTYQPNTTFTAGATNTFNTSIGVVYPYSTVRAFNELDNYPVSTEMARMIVIELLTKEFNIERQAIIDLTNNSVDDAKK